MTYKRVESYPWLSQDELKLYYTLPPWPEQVLPQEVTAARRLGRVAGAALLRLNHPELSDDELRRIVMLWKPTTTLDITGVSGVATAGNPHARLFKLCANLAGATFADLARLFGVKTSSIIQSVNGLMNAEQRSATRRIVELRLNDGNKMPSVSLPRLIEMREFFDQLSMEFRSRDKHDPIALAQALYECPTNLIETDEPELEQQLFGGESITPLTQMEIEQVVAIAKAQAIRDEVEEDFKDEEDY